MKCESLRLCVEYIKKKKYAYCETGCLFTNFFWKESINLQNLRGKVENQAPIEQKERRKCQHPVRMTKFSVCPHYLNTEDANNTYLNNSEHGNLASIFSLVTSVFCLFAFNLFRRLNAQYITAAVSSIYID